MEDEKLTKEEQRGYDHAWDTIKKQGFINFDKNDEGPEFNFGVRMELVDFEKALSVYAKILTACGFKINWRTSDKPI